MYYSMQLRLSSDRYIFYYMERESLKSYLNDMINTVNKKNMAFMCHEIDQCPQINW